MKTKFYFLAPIKSMVIIFLMMISFASFSQNGVPLTGTIKDGTGSGIPGATIVEKGTTNATVADIDGHFSLLVNPDATLVISFIGYATQEVSAAGKSTIDAVLVESSQQLDEVVVIGYGTTTKKEITGAVASLKTEDFNKGSFNDPMGMIQGKVAGLSITKPNGADPQAGYQIMLRGVNTLVAGQGPLIIIDGVIGADLKNVNWQDVASMDVLKDGSAAAIYGTRGTNGVIIITTKSAKSGKPVLEYSGQIGIQVNPRRVKNLNADEYTNLVNTYQPEIANDPTKAKEVLLGSKTDWFKQITRTSPVSSQNNLALSGGTENFTYRSSLTYSNDQGLLKSNTSSKLLTRTNIHQKALNQKLDLDFNIITNDRNYKPANYDLFYQAFIQNPTQPVYDPSAVAHGGYYFKSDVVGYYNPVAMLNERQQTGKTTDLTSNFRATLKLLPSLTISTFIAHQGSSYESNSYETRYYPGAFGSNGIAEISNGRTESSQLEMTFNYQQSIKDHNFQVVGGYSYQDFEDHNSYMRNGDFDTDVYGVFNIGAGAFRYAGTSGMDSFKETSKLVSLFGRAMYNYKEKYLLSVSARDEGSSKFGVNRKYGFFPAISAGWRVHQEDFMAGVSWVNELKLRGGYGVTGNQDFSPYQSLLLLQTAGKFFYNGQWINSYQPASNYNPNLQWEKKSEIDIGVDFRIFNKLSGSIDYYTRQSKNLLYTYNVSVPPYLYKTIFTNVGNVKNSGIELMLNAQWKSAGNLRWSTILTASHNSNKLVKLTDANFTNANYAVGALTGNFPVNTQLLQEGKSIGSFYGPKWLGIDELGHDKFKNPNPVGGVDPTKYENLGNPFPIVMLGLSNNISWKNFDLSFTFRSNIGGKILDTYRLYYESIASLNGSQNIVRSQLDNPGFKQSQQYSSKYLESGTFVKLDNVTLGYRVPVQSPYFSRVNATLTAQNVLWITKYKGLDPEVNMSGLSPGIDPLSYYPRTTSITLGLAVTFK